MIRTKIWSAIAVLVLIVLAPILAQAMTFNRIIVFGGSLSDSGNAFALTGFANRPPYDQLDSLLIPSGPYSIGGNHFSNGATWIEQLARPLGLSESVRPAFASKFLGGTDYAVGGARAREDGLNVNMPEQVAEFLKEFGNIAPSDALYVIDFGGNDVRDALDEALRQGNPNLIISDALNSIASNMRLLYDHGARKFLVLNVADIGTIPSILMADKSFPGIAAVATQLSVGFDLALNPTIALYFQDVSDEQIADFDVFTTVDTVIAAVIANPGAFGMTNADTACIEPDDAPFRCDTPEQYLFWDGIHPTKAGHAILAQKAAEVLGK